MPVPVIYGGAIFFSPSDAATVLHAYGDWVDSLPESTTASIALLRLPDEEAFPAPLRGKTTVHLRYVHVGDEKSGVALLAPMLQAAAPVLNLVGLMPYAAISSVHQDPADPMPVWDGALLLKAFPAAAVHALLGAAGPQVDVPLIIAELRHLGGAFSRGPAGGNAVGGRDAAFNFGAIGPYPPHLRDIVEVAANAVLDALRPWAHGGPQINFQGFAATQQDVRKAWDEPTLQRLRAVKTAWDPEQRFSFGYALDQDRVSAKTPGRGEGVVPNSSLCAVFVCLVRGLVFAARQDGFSVRSSPLPATDPEATNNRLFASPRLMYPLSFGPLRCRRWSSKRHLQQRLGMPAHRRGGFFE